MSDALIERVRAAVNEVPDPCSVAQGVPVGLVDMGLLCGVEVGAERDGCHDVQLELRLTGPGCFYGIHFEREIRQRLEAMPDVATIDVEFNPEFDWTQDDIAPHVQEELRARRERLLAQLPVGRRLPVAR